MFQSDVISRDELTDIFRINYLPLFERMGRWRKKYPEQYAIVLAESDFDKKFLKLFLEDGLTIFQITHELGCSTTMARAIKRRLIPDIHNHRIVKMNRRHNQLCKLIYGVQYIPGNNFLDHIRKKLHQHLQPHEAEDIIAYYISGDTDKETAKRLLTVRRFGEGVKQKHNIKQLKTWDIICLDRTR